MNSVRRVAVAVLSGCAALVPVLVGPVRAAADPYQGVVEVSTLGTVNGIQPAGTPTWTPPALSQPLVGVAATSDQDGAWEAAADGGVFAFGGAPFEGSLPALGVTPVAKIVGIAAAADGKGYWLVGSDGGVFAFGGAPFEGSLPGLHVTLAAKIVGIASTPDGLGYWLVGADGGVFAFGDAAYEGSLPGLHVTPAAKIVGIASTPDGLGYWLAGVDGGVFAFGDAPYQGGGEGPLPAPVVAIVSSTDAVQYTLVYDNESITAFPPPALPPGFACTTVLRGISPLTAASTAVGATVFGAPQPCTYNEI